MEDFFQHFLALSRCVHITQEKGKFLFHPSYKTLLIAFAEAARRTLVLMKFLRRGWENSFFPRFSFALQLIGSGPKIWFESSFWKYKKQLCRNIFCSFCFRWSLSLAYLKFCFRHERNSCEKRASKISSIYFS